MGVPADHPALLALDDELASIVRNQRARNAAVVDSSGNLWCHARDLTPEDMAVIQPILRELLDSADVPLASGGKARVVHADAEPFAYAISYAAIYVLIVWFGKAFDADEAHRPAQSAHRPR